MANEENLKHWKKGESGNPKGYPKGVKNRSTIVKSVLEMKSVLPYEIFNKLKIAYPEIDKTMSIEEIMTIVIAHKAITKADTNAYKVLMDSGYVSPVQQIEQTNIEQPLFPDVTTDDSD